jgi:hypothetical protein
MNKYDDLCSSKYCDGLAIEKVQRPFFGYNPANIKFCAFRKFTFFFFPSVSSVISQTLDGKNVKNTRKTCKNIQSYKILFTRTQVITRVIHHIRITHTHSMMYVLYFAFCINNKQKCRRSCPGSTPWKMTTFMSDTFCAQPKFVRSSF